MADSRYAGEAGLQAVFGQIKAAMAEKQDKINGMGLSHNDYSDTEKQKNAQNASDIVSLNNDIDDIVEKMDGDATTYPYADVITIEDAVPSNLADCNVKIEPVQDLHGYDKPWVGGAGKNKLDYDDNTTGYFTSGCSATSIQNYVVSMTASASDMSIGNYNNAGGLFAKSPCKAGDSYKIVVSDNSINKNYVTFLDDNNNIVSAARVDLESFSVPEGATKMGFRIGNGGAVSGTTYTTTVMVINSIETDSTFAPYTNVCPITGHTEVDVQRDGKNLFDKNNAGNLNGRALNPETGLPYVTSGWTTSSYIKIEPSTTYTLTTTSNSSSVAFYDSEKVYISGATSFGTKTTPSNAKYLRFDYKTENSGIIQLELGSKATPYEPYQGKTYTIALGSTIYGGTVDFDSGVMTVDRAIVDLGTLTWQKDSGGHSRFVANKVGMKLNGTVIADCFQTGTYNDVYSHIKDEVISLHDIYSQFAVHSTYYEADYDATQFGNAMSGHYACYELATPTTIQLTPQQIQLLKGTNTLTASTGQISVTVNGVSGSIGAVQEQVNGLAEKVAPIPIIRKGVVNFTSLAVDNVFSSDIVFDTPMTNADYTVTATASGTTVALCNVGNRTVNGFTVYVRNIGTAEIGGAVMWQVIG